jgi:hypothetical protein
MENWGGVPGKPEKILPRETKGLPKNLPQKDGQFFMHFIARQPQGLHNSPSVSKDFEMCSREYISAGFPHDGAYQKHTED